MRQKLSFILSLVVVVSLMTVAPVSAVKVPRAGKGMR